MSRFSTKAAGTALVMSGYGLEDPLRGSCGSMGLTHGSLRVPGECLEASLDTPGMLLGVVCGSWEVLVGSLGCPPNLFVMHTFVYCCVRGVPAGPQIH